MLRKLGVAAMLAGALLAGLGGAGWSQSLDAALKSAALDPGEFAIAVGGERLPLPHDAPALGQGASVSSVARTFGETVHRFGPVLAVASPTMTVLNAHLKPPQIYDGMPTGDAVKLLASTLTPKQWSALASVQGLGLADLAGPDQLALFGACVGTQMVQARPVSGEAAETVNWTPDLSQARLRLGSHTVVELPVSDHMWEAPGSPSEDGGPLRYSMTRFALPAGAALYGNVLKMEVPNTPKPGNLDFAAPLLRVPVPLTGLKTVGDLVSRIGALTKMELYADPHYARKSVTLLAGPSRAAAPGAAPLPFAGDLLRALAFCLTGTFRQVGPAFVLTDDIVGVGVRRRLYADMADLAQSLREKALDAAGDIIASQHSMADLHAFEGGADQAPTAAEFQSGATISGTPGVTLNLPLADLTPAQQAAARAFAAQAASEQGTRPLMPGEAHLPSLDGTLLLVTRPTLELLVPTVPGPIDFGRQDMDNLFCPSQTTQDAQREARDKAAEAARPAALAKTPPPIPAPSLAQVFARIPRRAALLNARTPAEIDEAVAGMKALGLNQLWLPVFTDGQARLPGTPFSAANGPDLLLEARRATQGTDIAVYAVLDLLMWGPEAAPAAQDLTLRGDNSAQALVRRAQRDEAANDGGPITLSPAQKRLAVSPFSPVVPLSLQALVRAVGAEPGLAGIVWRDTAPSGYVNTVDMGDDALGYTVSGRLAFLRSSVHADPIDFGSNRTSDSSLPNWDEGTQDETEDWARFRAGVDERLMRTLRAAWTANGTAGRPVLVQQRLFSVDTDWFGSWDSPGAPLPKFHAFWEMPAAGDPVYPDAPGLQAKAQSKVAVLRVNSREALRPSQLALYLSEHLKDRVKAPWDGFVLDFSDTEGADMKALQTLAGKSL